MAVAGGMLFAKCGGNPWLPWEISCTVPALLTLASTPSAIHAHRAATAAGQWFGWRACLPLRSVPVLREPLG